MAVASLGNTDNGGGGVTNVALTCAAAASIGDLVVVFAYDSNTTTPSTSVTDSKGNSYTLAEGFNSNWGQYVYYSKLTAALTTSDTITFTDSAASGFAQFYIEAVKVTGGIDTLDSATSNANNNGFASSFSVTGAGAASVSGELYFGFSATNDSFTGTPSGWTVSPADSPNPGAFMVGYQTNAGTSALTWNGTTTGAQNTDSIIVSFKSGGGGGGGGGTGVPPPGIPSATPVTPWNFV